MKIYLSLIKQTLEALEFSEQQLTTSTKQNQMKYKQIQIGTPSALPAQGIPTDIVVLIDEARRAVENAYAPYSGFHVGAALVLDNGEIVCGNNQENAAYPSGLCAERVALFYANSRYPGVAVRHLVIVAKNRDGFLRSIISPCGSCRQVMLETEIRQQQPMQIWLVSESDIFAIPSASYLLPLAFLPESLKGE